MTPLYLAAVPATEIEALLQRDDRLLLVAGATAPRDDALPPGAETRIVTTLAERLSAATGVVIAPPLPFGASESEAEPPGSMTLSEEVAQGVYLDLIKSAYRHGWRRLFILNGAEGNRRALGWAVSLACKVKRDLKIYVADWWTEESARALIAAEYGEGGERPNDEARGALLAASSTPFGARLLDALVSDYLELLNGSWGAGG